MTRRTPAPGVARRLAAPTLGLWAWLVPSACFWQLASARGLLLPTVPSAVWMLPGQLWRSSAPVFVAVLALVPVALHLLAARRGTERLTRRAALTVGAASLPVHLIWGWAVVGAGG